MSMNNEKYKRLLGFARSVITESAQENLQNELTQPSAVPAQWQAAAFSALEKLSADKELNTKEQWALEAIVLPKERPVVDIVGDEFQDVPAPWTHLANLKEQLKVLMPAMGRVNLNGSALPYAGTGFVCGKDLILTNRHVAELFIRGLGKRLWFLPGRSAWLDNKRERVPQSGLELRVKEAVFIHPYWDAALLRVQGIPEGFSQLKLRSTEPVSDEIAEAEIVVVGYPFESPYNDRALQEQIFRGQFGIKRMQPGKIKGYRQVVSFANTVEALIHDASTLGGNSGSAVISLDSMEVIGLHFAGVYLDANYAVPTWQLAQDPHVVDAGVNFVKPLPPAKTPPPAWLKSWEGIETPPSPGSTAKTEQPAPISPATLPLLPDWMERISEEEMKRLYQRDPEGFYQLLVETFGEEEAAEIRDELLFEASTEGLFAPEPDPDKPDLVLIHGILGGHLASIGGHRSWLNLLLLPFENLNDALSLGADGNDPHNLQPDGIVQSAYARAIRTWRRNRFRVHEFSFDWRKPIEESADRLALFLREQKAARPTARFVLVAHSMGGLVVSALGQKQPDWRQLIQKAIFCGSPLAGSFAIMEILTGVYPFVQKLAKVSLGNTLASIQGMAATFPGALQMLPDPELFPSADVLFERASYPAAGQPAQDWLAMSRKTKLYLRESPVLARTTMLISIAYPTIGGCTHQSELVRVPGGVRGDGTVPGRSAWVKGCPAYHLSQKHGDLLRDSVAIEIIPSIALDEPIGLQGLQETELDVPIAGEPEAVIDFDATAQEVRERIKDGRATAADVRWLLSDDYSYSFAEDSGTSEVLVRS